MNEAKIHEYLTKQITINNNIITFRLLSRSFSIHVNAAKSALATFYEANKGSSSLHATYLISGDAVETVPGEDSMDVDGVQVDAPSPLAEIVPRQKMMVVPEEKLEDAKSHFKSIRATHIYSVEPSKFMDPGLLVTTVDAVRKEDAKKSVDDLRKLGIPVSTACKYNPGLKTKGKAAAPAQPKASTSKEEKKAVKGVTAVLKKPSAEKIKAEPKSEPPVKKEAAKASLPKKTSASNHTGGLDWGKAKSKDAAKPAAEKAKSQQKAAQGKSSVTDRAPSVSSSTTSDPKPKRGIKRPTRPSDNEEDEDMKPPKAKARMSAPSKVSSIRTKKGVVLSDEEEEEDLPVKSVRRKIKSEATMDWSDDDNVVSAPRHIPGPPSSREDATENDDDDEEPEQSSLGEDPMEMSDGVGMDEPKYAKPARATKKAKWPVGANGLRKKRVVKTREFTDKRGFLQMEDYSEYESVNSESEEPPDPSVKVKKGVAKVRKVKEETVEDEPAKIAKQSSFKESAASKPKPKQGGSGAAKKKTLDSFFGKK